MPATNPPTRQPATAPTPWSRDDYPTAMVDLPSNVRDRAILAANELAAAGHAEREAIRLGIARAWDADGETDEAEPMPGPARFVYPTQDGWTIETVGRGRDGRFPDFEAALERATAISDTDGGRAYAFVDTARTRQVVAHAGSEPHDPSAFHVRPWDDGWALARLNAAESIFDCFDVKSDAVSAGRDRARDASSRLIIHRTDGSVQNSHDYRAS